MLLQFDAVVKADNSTKSVDSLAISSFDTDIVIAVNVELGQSFSGTRGTCIWMPPRLVRIGEPRCFEIGRTRGDLESRDRISERYAAADFVLRRLLVPYCTNFMMAAVPRSSRAK